MDVVSRIFPDCPPSAECILDMFLSPVGKVLIIGGSIANFTNVAATFKVKHAVMFICNIV